MTTRVYVAHQSVGAAVIEAIPAEVRHAVQHGHLGHNGDALGKIAAFDEQVRGGLGAQVDVAVMKLCYADVTSRTDVDALFATYAETLGRLERDLPQVRFLHATVPLSTTPGVRTRIKMALGRDPHLGPADNAARELYNAQVRRAFPAERVFDIAAVESTTPSGRRTRGTYRGQTYYRLHRGYASDPGHLNEAGARVAAAHLMDVVLLVHELTP